MKPLHFAGIAAVLLSGLSTRAAAQEAVLVLTVTASETEAPLQGAQVKVDGRGVVTTDAQGAARVTAAPGAHQVEVTAIGRHPQAFTARFAAGETQDLEVQLVPEAVPLTPVTATAATTPARSATLQRFYERAAAHSTGFFFTREYIDQRKPPQLSDLLLDHTGLHYVYTASGHRVMRFRDQVTRGGTADCKPKYYVNGYPYDVEQGSGDPSLDTAIHLDEVEGVEVYPRLPPIEYGGLGAACGVILVWLREDAGGFGPAPPAAPAPSPS